MATIFTIGHSNRSAAELVKLLQLHGIQRLVDVRRHPGSRRFPQFGQCALETELAPNGIQYQHEARLGGRRSGRAASLVDPQVGAGWRNRSFRAYAEHTQTDDYRQALAQLIATADDQRVAIMCSEAVPWRCHRWLVADTLLARGARVLHIMGTGDPRPHAMSSFARVGGDGTVTWPTSRADSQLRLARVDRLSR